jgi:signal transduction histidine kinase
MAALVQQVVEKYEAPMQERNHHLSLAGLEDLPGLSADGEALSKVVGDVLSNAIKYTPDGGRISISGRYQSGERAVELVISDTGIGIDPQVQELIFSKFCRTDDLAHHSTGATKFKGAGSGLGLTVARGLVEMHGGRIWVESPGHDEVGCPGSQFHILLPLEHSKV